MKPIIATLLLLLVSGPALAEEKLDGDLAFAKDGFIREMNEGYWDSSQNAKSASLWTELSNAAGRFKLYDGPLDKVQKQFGGERQVYDSFGYHHEWLCYVGGGQRVWYIEDQGSMDWVVAETSNPETDADYGCVEQPLAALTSEAFPSIGASWKDLAAQFDAPIDQYTDRQVYTGVIADELSYTRTVYYRLKDGIVTGVSFAEGPGFL